MKKNDVLTLKIESLGEGGEGVARHEGMAVFVPFAIIGESVQARIIMLKKSYAVAKLEQVIVKSEDRIQPICPVFGKCGGCQLMHMNKSAQEQFKKNKVEESLKRIGFINNHVDDVVESARTTRYRNKLQIPLHEREGVKGGFYAPFSHRIVEIEDCFLQTNESVSVFQAVKKYAEKAGVKGYDEMSHKGLLRSVVTRQNKNDMIITVVINGNSLPKLDCLVEELKKTNLNFGLYCNINKEQTNVVCQEEYIHLYGIKELDFDDDGIKYSVLPMSFLQVNEDVKNKMYEMAVEKAELKNDDVVVNAYSGAGLLTAYFAEKCKLAYGIEIVKEATLAANNLAKENGLTEKMINITGDCAKEISSLIPKLKKENNGKIVFVLDPPRKGVEISILQELLQAKPDKIIYISCNPASLARDLGVLTNTLYATTNGIVKNPNLDHNPTNEINIKQNPDSITETTPFQNLRGNGDVGGYADCITETNPLQNPTTPQYEITSITPFDMFPQTKHIETLVCLARK